MGKILFIILVVTLFSIPLACMYLLTDSYGLSSFIYRTKALSKESHVLYRDKSFSGDTLHRGFMWDENLLKRYYTVL